MKPAYMIFNVQVDDAQGYEAYRAFSSQAMSEFGAEPLVRGGALTVLEGDWYPRVVVLKFASVAQAQAFYNSATYQQGLAIRQKAAIAHVAIVEGA